MGRGKGFELEVKEILESELKSGALGVDSSLAKVFHRKDYPSILRKKPIITDVSLEAFRRGATEPFLVWIWECKDYKKRVPVDDVEEFHGKLDQMAVHKTKGTIACRD